MKEPLPARLRDALRPGEEVLWWGRPARIAVVPPVAGLLLAFAVGLTARSGAVTGTAFLVAFAIGTAAFERTVRIVASAYAVTDRRFYAVTSLVSAKAQSVPWSRVSHVSLRRGPFGLLLGLWSARVSAYGEAGAVLNLIAIRDGPQLLAHAADGQARGANAAWLLSGD